MAFTELTNNKFAEQGYYEVGNLLDDQQIEKLLNTLERGNVRNIYGCLVISWKNQPAVLFITFHISTQS